MSVCIGWPKINRADLGGSVRPALFTAQHYEQGMCLVVEVCVGSRIWFRPQSFVGGNVVGCCCNVLTTSESVTESSNPDTMEKETKVMSTHPSAQRTHARTHTHTHAHTFLWNKSFIQTIFPYIHPFSNKKNSSWQVVSKTLYIYTQI